MKTFSALVVLGAAGILGASCTSDTEVEPGTARNAQMQGTSTADAAERIAAARCNYEQKCGNVGATADFKDRNHCLQVQRKDMRESLDGDCQYGVSKSDLSDCLTEVGNQDCAGVGMAIDVVERSFECSSSELCLD